MGLEQVAGGDEARAAESEITAGKYRGPLHGIPFAAKDLLAAKGYHTEWGARPYQMQQFQVEATAITRLHDAGAILIGKAAMIELAGGMGYRFASASISGPARNPWNTDCWTCGSSSGSGAIVAAGLAAFALGSETWGSIVCPSAFCGVSGLRPTYGRVSRHGAMVLSYSMDKIGPLARSAEDCALVLDAIAADADRRAALFPNGLNLLEVELRRAPFPLLHRRAEIGVVDRLRERGRNEQAVLVVLGPAIEVDVLIPGRLPVLLDDLRADRLEEAVLRRGARAVA